MDPKSIFQKENENSLAIKPPSFGIKRYKYRAKYNLNSEECLCLIYIF